MEIKESTQEIGKRFVAAFSLFWLFLESLNSFGLISLTSRGATYYLLLTVASLLTAVVNYYIGVFNKKNIRLYKYKRAATVRVNSIKRHAARFLSEGSYFKLLFLDWRLQVELIKIRNLTGEHIQIEGRQPIDNITYIFRSILTKLQAGDEYITVSCIDFWEHVKLHRGFFLTENVEAAKRGVKIRRVIVIESAWLNKVSHESQFNRLKTLVDNLYEKYEDDPDNFVKMELLFFVSENYEKDAAYPVPYAMITNDTHNDYMALLPRLHDYKESPFIDIYFTQDKNNPHFITHTRRFEDLYNKKSNKFTLQEMKNKMK